MRSTNHRREIAAKLSRVSDVERQQVEQIVAQPPGLIEPDWRNPQSLLKDLGGTRVVGAMRGAADIALMGTNDGPEQTPLTIEERHERGEVGQMAAAVIGIVEQDDIARLDVLESFLDGERRPAQRADMHGYVIGLRDQPPPGVADRQREIAARVEDLRIGGAK